MDEYFGEISSFQAQISGEIRPEDIPLAPGVDLAALKAGDDDPMEVAVEIPTGKNTKGWNYEMQSLVDIVTHVNKYTLNGLKGHQELEKINTECPDPVTHWVGGMIRDKKAYFRGVMDRVSPNLKRWVRTGRIKEVSIFGIPKLKRVNGEIHVTGYKPMSIDWTPLNRPGMPTRITAIGEMDAVFGELDGSHDELREVLQTAIKKALNSSEKNYVWVRRVWDDHCIAQQDGDPAGIKYFKIPYGVIDSKIELGTPVPVELHEEYKPVGEIFGGENIMNWKELLVKLKAMVSSGEVTRAQVCGEMGWNAQQVAGEIDAGWVGEVTEAKKTLDQVRDALGVTGEMYVVQVATNAAEALKAQNTSKHEGLVGEVLGEKVTGEMAQNLVRPMLHIAPGATKEQIAGEIDLVLANPDVKAAFSRMHIDRTIPGGTSSSKSAPAGLKKRTVAI